MIRFLHIAAALSLAFAAPSTAQSDADRAAVAVLVNEFETAFRQNDMVGVMDFTPPGVWSNLADTLGVSVDDLREVTEIQMTQMMAQVTVEQFGMDVAAANGGVTQTGRPYFLIPSEMTMEVIETNQRIHARSDTLAFEDQGQWWLVRVQDANNRQMLVDAYPDLAQIDIAVGTMEVLQ